MCGSTWRSVSTTPTASSSKPQLTLDEFKVWNRVFASDYRLMGPEFDPIEEAQRNEREFERFAPVHESQMGAFFRELLTGADR